MKKYFLFVIILLLSCQKGNAVILMQSGNGKITFERMFVVKDTENVPAENFGVQGTRSVGRD